MGTARRGFGQLDQFAWSCWRNLVRLTLAQCPDGTFYYQPNRDNAGYGNEARLQASAVVAFVLSIPEASLQITGKGAVR